MARKNRKCERTNTKVITWEELVAHEPSLNDLLIEARSIKDDYGSYFCKREAYVIGWMKHSNFSSRIHRLVGFGSCHSNSFLQTAEAWNVVLDTILEALPPCRNCMCVNADEMFL